MVGESYSLADIMWTPVLHRMESLGFDELWNKGRRPAVAEYYERVKGRPSFKKAISEFATTRQRLKYVAPRLVPATILVAFAAVGLAAANFLLR